MKQLPLVISIIALVLGGIALYQQNSESKSAKPAPAKTATNDAEQTGKFTIAYFEMDSIENNYQYVKDSYKQVKSKEEDINQELSALERTYQKKISEWQQKGAQMSQAENEQVQKEYAQMQQNFQQRKMSFEQELNELRNKKLRDIQVKIEDFLKEYNKEKKYSFIFSYEPALFIYYKDSAYDITTELLAGLNGEYAKKETKK